MIWEVTDLIMSWMFQSKPYGWACWHLEWTHLKSPSVASFVWPLSEDRNPFLFAPQTSVNGWRLKPCSHYSILASCLFPKSGWVIQAWASLHNFPESASHLGCSRNKILSSQSVNGRSMGVHTTILIWDGSVHTMQFFPSIGMIDWAASFQSRTDGENTWPQRMSPFYYFPLQMKSLFLIQDFLIRISPAKWQL